MNEHEQQPEEPQYPVPEGDYLKIRSVPPYDGNWPCDLSRFTNRELRTFKRVSGIVAAKMKQALIEGDQDALVGLTVVMLERTSKFTVLPDILWDADGTAIEFVDSDAEPEEEELDPNSPTPSEPNSELLGSESESDTTTLSGETGDTSSETTEEESPPTTGAESSES